MCLITEINKNHRVKKSSDIDIVYDEVSMEARLGLAVARGYAQLVCPDVYIIRVPLGDREHSRGAA